MTEESWTGNYFNYFTEVEEHFQRARGTSLFMMSPLDWALVESWKNSGVPIEAVLRGIDDAFAKYHQSKRKNRSLVNSLAYCSQAVTKAAEEMANNRPAKRAPTAEDSLPLAPLQAELLARVSELESKGYPAQAASVAEIASRIEEFHADLEGLEQRLSAIEDSILAQARAAQSEGELLIARQELDAELRPHRGRLSAAELSLLEKSFLDRRLFDRLGLRRLSLFFLL